jgi:chromosome segregation ATPase
MDSSQQALRSQNTQLRQSIESLAGRVDEWAAANHPPDRIPSEPHPLQKEVLRLREMLSDLIQKEERSSLRLSREISSLRSQLAQTQSALDQAQKHEAHTKSRIASLSKSLASSRSSTQQLEQEKAALLKDMQRLEQALSSTLTPEDLQQLDKEDLDDR